MNKQLRIIALFSVLFLVSCSAKDDDAIIQQPTAATNCRPVSYSRVSNFNNQIDDSTQHFYDTAGRLIKIVHTHPHWLTNEDTTKITYDQQGRILKISGSDENIGYDLHQYNNAGQLSKITDYSREEPWSTVVRPVFEQIFEYNTAGEMKKVRYVPLVPMGGIPVNPVSYCTFTYNAAGLIAIDSAYYEQNGKKNFVRKIEFLYDSKIGVSNTGLGPTSFNWPYRFAPRKHNIISETRTEAGGKVYKYTVQYHYNSLGYPVKAFISNVPGGLSHTSNISYNCF